MLKQKELCAGSAVAGCMCKRTSHASLKAAEEALSVQAAQVSQFSSSCLQMKARQHRASFNNGAHVAAIQRQPAAPAPATGRPSNHPADFEQNC